MLAKLRSALTPHRLLTLSTDLTGLAATVSGLVGVMPAGWQNTALVGVGLAAKAATTLKFLGGNSHWETSPAGQALLTGRVPSLAEVETEVRRLAASLVRTEIGKQLPAPVRGVDLGRTEAAQETIDIPDAPLPPPGLDAPPPDPQAVAPAPAVTSTPQASAPQGA